MAYTLPPKDDRSSSYSSPNSSNRSYFTEEQANQPGFIEMKWENDRVRIRAEILEKEKARFRVLEEEIRMELKLEREAAIQRWEASTKRVDPLRTCKPLIDQCEERVVPSATVVRVDNLPASGTPQYALRMRYDAPSKTCQVGGYQHHLMPIANSGLGLSQIKPLSKPPKETVVSAKLEADVCGLNRKRKASTLGADRPRGSNLEKKSKRWTCELFKISTTGEACFDDHLNGKKHKLMEEGLLPVVDEKQKSKQKSLVQKLGPSITPAHVDSAKKLRLWCKICQVGAHSEKVFADHEKGKKHLANLEELEKAAPVSSSAMPPVSMEKKFGNARTTTSSYKPKQPMKH